MSEVVYNQMPHSVHLNKPYVLSQLVNFTSEEVVAHSQAKRLLHHPGAVQGVEYRIEYKFKPEPGLPACVFDIRCFDTAEEALNHSAPVEENPVGKDYR